MTIAAEQAQALKAGITPGRWKAADAKGTFGILCYEDIRNDTGVSVASAWHSDDYAPLPDRKTRAGNASAIAAIPDMLDTIIAQEAEVKDLKSRLVVMIANAEALARQLRTWTGDAPDYPDDEVALHDHKMLMLNEVKK